MAKRVTIGSVVKGDPKKGTSDYISLKPGVAISINGKPLKLAGKNSNIVNLSDPHKLPEILLGLGKIDADIAAEMKANAAKTPFVRFNLSVNEE